MCKGHLEVTFMGKKVCGGCNWDETCDLVIGAVDLESLGMLVNYMSVRWVLEHEVKSDEIMDIMRLAIQAMIREILTMLGLKPTLFKVVHKINEDLPQFAPKSPSDKDLLIFKTPDELARIGVYFALGDDFDENEFIAFNNLVKHALSTDTIKTILMFKNLDPTTGLSDDYHWVIIYRRLDEPTVIYPDHPKYEEVKKLLWGGE